MITHVRSIGALVAAMLVFAGSPASAQTPAAARAALPTPVIGIVDLNLIQEQAGAMKSIREQQQKEEGTLRGEIEKREKDLHDKEQDLLQQRTLLSPEAFNERKRGFEQQVADYQRYMAARKRQLDTGFGEGMRTADGAFREVLKEVATERGLNIILPRQSTLLAEGVLDVTQDVKQRLDKRLPRVAVKLPPLEQTPSPSAKK